MLPAPAPSRILARYECRDPKREPFMRWVERWQGPAVLFLVSVDHSHVLAVQAKKE